MPEKECTIEDETFSYVCLNEFTNWDDYEQLIDLMDTIPGISFRGELIEGPYSRYRDFDYDGIQLTLMYHNEIGNCIRINKGAAAGQLTQVVLKLCREIERMSK